MIKSKIVRVRVLEIDLSILHQKPNFVTFLKNDLPFVDRECAIKVGVQHKIVGTLFDFVSTRICMPEDLDK